MRKIWLIGMLVAAGAIIFAQAMRPAEQSVTVTVQHETKGMDHGSNN